METEYKYPPTTEQMELFAAAFNSISEEERPFLTWSVTRAAKCFRAELDGTLTPDQAGFLKAFRQVGNAARPDADSAAALESVRALYKADLLGWQVVQ